jgi:hypothetical protein
VAINVNINQEGPPTAILMFSVSSGGSVRSKDARGFVAGDGADYAFAYTIISMWEGARA